MVFYIIIDITWDGDEMFEKKDKKLEPARETFLKYGLLLSFCTIVTFASSSIAKLELGCSMGNEKSCQKLAELKNTQSGVKIPNDDTKLNSSSHRAYTPAAYSIDYSCNVKVNINIWRNYGVTNDPREARRWACAGFRSIEARDWKRSGVETAQEAKEWLQLQVGDNFVDDLKKIGVHSPHIAKNWVNEGIKAYSIPYWMDVGVKTPNVAKQWIDAGVVPNDVHEWTKIGVDVSDVQKWKTIGSVYKVKEWKDLGISINDALQWKQLGFGTYAIKKWRKLGIKTADEAQKWFAIGLKESSDIAKWLNADIDSIQEVKKWRDAGFNSGYRWKKAGFTVEEAVKWKGAGIHDGYKYKNNGLVGLSEALEAQKCKQLMNYDVFNNKGSGILSGRILQSLPDGGYLVTAYSELYYVAMPDNKLRSAGTHIMWRVTSMGNTHRYNSVGQGIQEAAIVNYLPRQYDKECSKHLEYQGEFTTFKY